jgi:hypothetical protein
MCHDCRGFDAAAGDTSRLFHLEVRAVEGGWREARIFDGEEFSGWLCPDVHGTAQGAERCPEKKSLLGYRSPGHLLTALTSAVQNHRA